MSMSSPVLNGRGRSSEPPGQITNRSNPSAALDTPPGTPAPSTPSSRPISRSSSSVSITLDIEPQQIVYVNTLSSVLNDPKVKTSTFVSPQINPSPMLVDAPLSSFRPYLQKTHDLYSNLQSQRKKRRDQQRAEIQASHEDSAHSDSNSSVGYEDVSNIGNFEASSKKKQEIVDSRSEVPGHFFDEHFNLSNPTTFYKTFYDGTPHKVLSNKMIEYLDLVEQDLTEKLNRRTDAFFGALREMQSLHFTVIDMNRKIKELKNRITTADEELVVKSLEIVGQKIRKSNMERCMHKLKCVQAIYRSLPKIELMIEGERYFDALETVRSAETLIKNELQGATCADGFKSKLDKFSKRIKLYLSAVFVDKACGHTVLMEDDKVQLRQLVIELQLVGQLISTLEAYSDVQQQKFKALVSEAFLSMSSSNSNIHQSSSSSDLNADKRKLVELQPMGIHSKAFDDSEQKMMQDYELIAEKVSSEEFNEQLQSVLEEMETMIVRAKDVHTLIDQVFKDLNQRDKDHLGYINSEYQKYLDGKKASISSSKEGEHKTAKAVSQKANGTEGGKSGSSEDASSDDDRDDEDNDEPVNSLPTITSEEQIQAIATEQDIQKRLRTKIGMDSYDIVYTVAEVGGALIARLLQAREELNVRLPIQEFAQLYNRVSQFVRDVDKIVGKPCPTLRVIMNSQSKSMFEDWDRRMCKKLSHTLNAENWARAEIAAEFAAIFKCLYNPKQPIQIIDTSKETDNAKSITLGTERFALVNGELIFGKLMYDYLVVLDILPLMYSDVISKLAEAIILWSKLTYGLVLKQGAIENQVVQGSINIGHLSLAANCLSVQIALIPKLKERVLAAIPDDGISVLSTLDKCTEDCATHLQEIYSKMITTMRNRVDACFKVYKVEDGGQTASKAVVTLMEATQKMHKILQTYLSPNTFKSIFRQILSTYNSQIKSHLNQLNIKTPKEKSKLLIDINYILTQLRALDGVDDPTDELAEFVHERFKQ